MWKLYCVKIFIPCTKPQILPFYHYKMVGGPEGDDIKTGMNWVASWTIWVATYDFQHDFQCGILTSVDSDEHVQPPFKLRISKWCSVSSLTVLDYSSDQQMLWSDCAYAHPIWGLAGRTYHIVGNVNAQFSIGHRPTTFNSFSSKFNS